MKTVLVVDDQPEVLRLYARGLEVAGYKVNTAETVEDGLQLIESDPPDAVLVDLKMPYINGMGMLYRLRKVSPKMPVAIITGMRNLDEETLQELALLEATVRYKPISIPQLQELVNELVAGKP